MFNKHFRVTAAHFIGLILAFKLLNFILPSFLLHYYFYTANVLLFSIVSWYSFAITKKFFLKDKIRPENKAVLITGCDSGFGHNLAKRLDSGGFNVFATCMFPSGAGAENLKNSCSKRLQILHLDVTKDESVQSAVEFVKENFRHSELWAIVNNAGIHEGLAVELTGIQGFKNCMEVNVFGAIRVTKAFLPFLKESKGRVVNITSYAGRVTAPHIAPYIISKYAAVAFSDLLRQELADWGIRVISVEPELFRTGLTNVDDVEKRLDDTFNKLNEAERVEYDKEYKNNLQKSTKILLRLASPKIQVVIDDLESAISLKYPNAVYSPRRNTFLRLILYIYATVPIPIRDILAKVALRICRYKTPKATVKYHRN